MMVVLRGLLRAARVSAGLVGSRRALSGGASPVLKAGRTCQARAAAPGVGVSASELWWASPHTRLFSSSPIEEESPEMSRRKEAVAETKPVFEYVAPFGAALKRVLQHVEGVPPEAPALTGLDWSSSTVRDAWKIEGAHPSIECLDRERNGWRQVARGPKACILKWHGLECTPQHHRSGLCGKV